MPLRSTPTLVGKTQTQRKLPQVDPVHPHACGENKHYDGPPPRLWGKLITTFAIGHIAPVHPHACGENVALRFVVLNRRTVHPHACGENSSQRLQSVISHRSTPTLVGKTLLTCNIHPHAIILNCEGLTDNQANALGFTSVQSPADLPAICFLIPIGLTQQRPAGELLTPAVPW
jgi:hypothetical protein